MLSMRVTVTFYAVVGLTSAGIVCAQEYPSKPIRFVTSAAGEGG